MFLHNLSEYCIDGGKPYLLTTGIAGLNKGGSSKAFHPVEAAVRSSLYKLITSTKYFESHSVTASEEGLLTI